MTNRKIVFGLFLVIGLLENIFAISFKSNQYYFVSCDGKNVCTLKEGKGDGKSHAYGMYNDDVEKDGWGKLWVHGDASFDGWWEAGFLEGSLTAQRIYQHYKSWYSYQFPESAPLTPQTEEFMIAQYNFARSLVDANPNDLYYTRLGQVLTQFEGVNAGLQYAANDNEKLTKNELLLLEAAGDLYDIVPATTPSSFKLKIGKLNFQQFDEEWHRMVSCSAMIKIPDDLSDVFIGHTTWTSYVNMLRVYKNYNLHNGDYQVSFSAKPGVIYSKDDFYVLPSERQQLTVLETTNGIMNSNLYPLITPKSLLTWQRIPLTNSLATSGKEWVNIFTKYNSGTYCNQYMIIDMKRFIKGKGPQSDFLWITEVLPGTTASEDVTPIVKHLGNVWPSFNIPYFKNIYILSGYQQAYETYGDAYSYENCSRALMMRRDHVNIQTFADMQAEMRQDNYKTDIYADNDPGNAISPRRDLRTSKGSAFGGIDAKVTSYSRLTKSFADHSIASSVAQSGPPHSNSDLPPFQWSTSNYTSVVHLGQPDTFNFDFVEMNFYEN